MKAGRHTATLGLARLFVQPALLVLLRVPGAHACPYDRTLEVASAHEAQVTDAAAAHAAHGAALLGANSAWATGLMARHVMTDGRDWTFTGQIARAANDLVSQVAVPFRTVANEGVLLVGTELLENLVLGGHAGDTLGLAGRSSKGEDGVVYVVITRYQVLNS